MPRRHANRRGLERLTPLGVPPHALRHAVEDPLPQRCRIDVIEVREQAREQRRITRSLVAACAALGEREIGAALDGADVGRAPPERGGDAGQGGDADARGEKAPGSHFPAARTTSVPFILEWPLPQYSVQVTSNVPARSATNSTVTPASPFGIGAFTRNALIAKL